MFTLQNLNNSIFCKVQLAKMAFIENKNEKNAFFLKKDAELVQKDLK